MPASVVTAPVPKSMRRKRQFQLSAYKGQLTSDRPHAQQQASRITIILTTTATLPAAFIAIPAGLLKDAAVPIPFAAPTPRLPARVVTAPLTTSIRRIRKFSVSDCAGKAKVSAEHNSPSGNACRRATHDNRNSPSGIQGDPTWCIKLCARPNSVSKARQSCLSSERCHAPCSNINAADKVVAPVCLRHETSANQISYQ